MFSINKTEEQGTFREKNDAGLPGTASFLDCGTFGAKTEKVVINWSELVTLIGGRWSPGLENLHAGPRRDLKRSPWM